MLDTGFIILYILFHYEHSELKPRQSVIVKSERQIYSMNMWYLANVFTGVTLLIFVDFGSVFNCLCIWIMSIFLHVNVISSVYKCTRIPDPSHVTGLFQHFAVIKTSENFVRLWDCNNFSSDCNFVSSVPVETYRHTRCSFKRQVVKYVIKMPQIFRTWINKPKIIHVISLHARNAMRLLPHAICVYCGK